MEEAKFQVRVKQDIDGHVAFFDGAMRRPGESLMVTEKQFSSKWMERVHPAKPAAEAAPAQALAPAQPAGGLVIKPGQTEDPPPLRDLPPPDSGL